MQPEKILNGCLKILIITIVSIIAIIAAILLFFFISDKIQERKLDIWYEKNFEDYSPPVNSMIIKTDYKQGKIDNGNRESNDFGAYWVIETPLSKEEVTAYYDKIVLESNKNVIGFDSYLFVHNMPDNNYYIFDDIREYMETFDPSQYSQNIFIVYVIKPGRHFLWN